MEGTSLKEAAIEYAMSGYYVAPLWPKCKEPLRGFSFGDPSDNPEAVRYWWERCEDANIAFPTGRQYNNLIVIDLDISNEADGCKTLERIIKEEGFVFPKTLTAQSGSGGIHLYYKNVLGIKIESRKDYLPGIDILSDGAHVVAPPSIHPSGKRYKWLTDFEIPAFANDDLYSFLTKYDKNVW